jgi:hypothetical protein
MRFEIRNKTSKDGLKIEEMSVTMFPGEDGIEHGMRASVTVNSDAADELVWINIRRHIKELHIILDPKETIELAKSLYKAAYIAGYGKETK